MRKILFLFILGLVSISQSCSNSQKSEETGDKKPEGTVNKAMELKINKSEDEWKQILTPEQYKVLRMKGTEPPYSGKYYHNKETGVYHCAACDAPLFTSDTKYESGSGWPSFFKPVSDSAIIERKDNSLFLARIELICASCGSHLGHVFDDGPDPTGLRYCINSVSLNFTKK